MCNKLEELNLHDPTCVTSILQLLEKHIIHLQESLDNERRRRLVLEAHCKKLEHLNKTYQLQEMNKRKMSSLKRNEYGRRKLNLYNGNSDDDTKADVIVPAFGETSLNTALVSYTCSWNEESTVAIKEELEGRELSMENGGQHSALQSTDKINENLSNACSSDRLLKERNYNSTTSVVGDEAKGLSPLTVDMKATSPKRLCTKRMSLLKRTKESDKEKISHDKISEAKQVSLTEMLTRLTKKDAIGSDQGVTNDWEIQCSTSKRTNFKTISTENTTAVTPPPKRHAHSQDIFRIFDSSSDDDDVNVLLRSPPTADGSLRAILATPASPVTNECPSVAVVTQASPDIIYVADTNEECWATVTAKVETGSQHIQLENNCATKRPNSTSVSKPIDRVTQRSPNISYSSKSAKIELKPKMFTRSLAEDRDNQTSASKCNLKQQYNIDCKDCQGYIDLMGNTVTNAEIEKLLRNCKRHKTGNMPLQESPVGFWNPLLLSFPEDDSRNEILIDHRFTKTNN